MMQDDGRLFLHNHLRFTILYHRDVETDLSRIVGFEVKPFSVQHKYEGTWNPDKPDLSTCNPGSMKYVSDKDEPQEVKEGREVIFTYDVVYEVRQAKVQSVCTGGSSTSCMLSRFFQKTHADTFISNVSSGS